MDKEELEKLMEHIELKMAIKKVDKEPFGYEEIQLIKLCKICSELQQENNRLKENNLAMQEEMCKAWEKLNIIKELRSWLEDEIHNIVPEGCGINYNCEYDSEEDYVRAMEERSRLNTLKDTLSKLNELEGKNE